MHRASRLLHRATLGAGAGLLAAAAAACFNHWGLHASTILPICRIYSMDAGGFYGRNRVQGSCFFIWCDELCSCTAGSEDKEGRTACFGLAMLQAHRSAVPLEQTPGWPKSTPHSKQRALKPASGLTGVGAAAGKLPCQRSARRPLPLSQGGVWVV